MTTATELREIRPVSGPSDIPDSDERDSLIDAIANGDILRESHTGEPIEDFLRVIAYQVPGSTETRYALHRLQGDGVEYVHDHTDKSAVEASYEEAVRDLSDLDTDPWWAVTDVPGVRVMEPEDLEDDDEDEAPEDDD